MSPQKRDLQSSNPLDSPSDPEDQLDDPGDPANANRRLRWALSRGPRLVPDPAAVPDPGMIAFDIRALRERLRLSQRQFAGWFGFPVATLRHWERGNRRPTGTALVLLTVIRDNPRAVMQAVRKARIWDRNLLPGIEPVRTYRAPPDFGLPKEVMRPRKRRR
jgi:putative transcriptional regulator